MSVETRSNSFRYWAVAIPTYIGVVWMLSIVGYLAINLISTPPLDSKYTVTGKFRKFHLPTSTDEIFREMDEDTQMNSVEGHIPPIVDIPIDIVNKFLYHGPSDQKL